MKHLLIDIRRVQMVPKVVTMNSSGLSEPPGALEPFETIKK